MIRSGRRGLTVVIGAVLIIGGCQPSAGGTSARDPGDGASSDPPGGQSVSPGDSVPADPEIEEEESSYGLLVIDGEGLRVFAAVSGASRPLPFGTSYEIVRDVVSAIIGSDPIEEGFSTDCQTRYARWAGDLLTWYIEDHFVGWALRSPDAPISTASGIKIGSTRAELDDAYDARVFESSLGVEFSAGGLSGVLAGAGEDARVINLWAGQACIAR